jgi:hypothetical protein
VITASLRAFLEVLPPEVLACFEFRQSFVVCSGDLRLIGKPPRGPVHQ